jgi:SET domain-containing protein
MRTDEGKRAGGRNASRRSERLCSSSEAGRYLDMLLVKTKVAPSAVHGLGVFADQFIPKGTRIWEFDETVDARFDQSRLDGLPEAEQEALLAHCYVNPRTGLYVFCGDNARYLNHSDEPNTEDVGYDEGLVNGEGVTIAARDIHPGEEIFSDYAAFDADFRAGIL